MAKTSRILLVDDTPENLDILSTILEDFHCQLLVATSGERALELATKRLPDLILLDVMMPQMSGFEVCTRLKAQIATTEIPIIFVTARAEDVSEGFRVGGADYITKPINADEVRARVRYQLERQVMLHELKSFNRELESKVRERTAELTGANRQLRKEVNERRYMQDRLNYLATHDFVTRLHNRNALEAFVAELLVRVHVQSVHALFLLIDIDRFRTVNESCGCIAGDELLRQFSDSISGLLARDDFFARLGGDKFAIVTYGHDGIKNHSLARMIVSHLEHFRFHWEDKEFTLSASIACVPLTSDMMSFDQVMLVADEVIYLAKREARGNVFTYEDAIKRSNLQKDNINWASRLMNAIQKNAFRAHFQMLEFFPASCGDAKPIYRLEVLLRMWDEIANKLVPPVDFIGPAERLNLIPELDKWMVNHTFAFFAEHPELIDKLERVSINLSAISVREAQFTQYVIESLSKYKLAADKFCFEITETEAIINVESARNFMHLLQDRGFHFALDDFGSGFASYAYLHQLAFDSVKIDGMFVRDMNQDPNHFAMVKSIIEMARSLDKEIITEFVENAEVAGLLRELGVDWGQGFLHHYPEELTAEALKKHIATS
jgi:diguanylate cyclase (GGDEF)-like protein